MHITPATRRDFDEYVGDKGLKQVVMRRCGNEADVGLGDPSAETSREGEGGGAVQRRAELIDQ